MPKSYVNKISSLLIANRGEIAIRIMRAASELGIKGPAHKTTSAQRVKITNKYYSNVKKRDKQRKN